MLGISTLGNGNSAADLAIISLTAMDGVDVLLEDVLAVGSDDEGVGRTVHFDSQGFLGDAR